MTVSTPVCWRCPARAGSAGGMRMIADHAKRSRGFSLIEALIALLVLSIGMLGAAAMQLNALQSAHIAYQRSIATLAAQDAQERLWALVDRDNDDQLICPDASEVASLEAVWLTDWNERKFLPGFSGKSAIAPEPGAPVSGNCVFKITVSWDEERVDEGAEPFIYRVRLPGEPSNGT